MKRLISLIALLSIIVAGIVYAPKYLTYADQPAKSDVIVLFPGGEYIARRQEALKLIEEGYAQRLFIPEYGIQRSKGIILNNIPKYLEDTQVEVLESKRMMDQAGFRSAIFVSSPYHMRRIRIMARRLFGTGDYRLTFVPSRYEQHPGGLWVGSRRDSQFIVREYAKIAWCLIYGFFTTSLKSENLTAKP